MRRRDRWIMISLSAVGLTVCLLAAAGFVWSIVTNNLPWNPSDPVRHFYQHVGAAFSDGFLVGFFVCFFLVLAAVGLRAREARDVGEDECEAGASARTFDVVRGGRS